MGDIIPANLKPLVTTFGMAPSFEYPSFFVSIVIHIISPLGVIEYEWIIGTHSAGLTAPCKFIFIAGTTPGTRNEHHCFVLYVPISDLPTPHPRQQDVQCQTGLAPDLASIRGAGLSQSDGRAFSPPQALS